MKRVVKDYYSLSIAQVIGVTDRFCGSRHSD